MENLNILLQGLIFISCLFIMRKFAWKVLLPIIIKRGEIVPDRFKIIPCHLSLIIFSSVFLIATIVTPLGYLYFGIIALSFLVINNLTLRELA